MKQGLSQDITFIDTNGFIKGQLEEKHFDKYGLHYTPNINRQIHQFIELQISKKMAQINGYYHLMSAMPNRNRNEL